METPLDSGEGKNAQIGWLPMQDEENPEPDQWEFDDINYPDRQSQRTNRRVDCAIPPCHDYRKADEQLDIPTNNGDDGSMGWLPIQDSPEFEPRGWLSNANNNGNGSNGLNNGDGNNNLISGLNDKDGSNLGQPGNNNNGLGNGNNGFDPNDPNGPNGKGLGNQDPNDSNGGFGNGNSMDPRYGGQGQNDMPPCPNFNFNQDQFSHQINTDSNANNQEATPLAMPDLPFEKPELMREDFDCQADFGESSEETDQEEKYEYSQGTKPNTMDCGIQTSNAHFRKISKSKAFQDAAKDKAFNTDFAFSALYNDL